MASYSTSLESNVQGERAFERTYSLSDMMAGCEGLVVVVVAIFVIVGVWARLWALSENYVIRASAARLAPPLTFAKVYRSSYAHFE